MTLGWTEPLSGVSGVCTLSPRGEPQGFPVPSEMSLFIRTALLEQSQGGKENLQKKHTLTVKMTGWWNALTQRWNNNMQKAPGITESFCLKPSFHLAFKRDLMCVFFCFFTDSKKVEQLYFVLNRVTTCSTGYRNSCITSLCSQSSSGSVVVHVLFFFYQSLQEGLQVLSLPVIDSYLPA